MTRSVFFLFFFTVSLMLIFTATTASAGNVTSGISNGGCASGDTVSECIKAVVEEDEEGVEAVVRRILEQQRRKLSYKALQKQPTCNGKIAGNCIGIANRGNAPCTYYNRCKRAT
ncbi:unnamed protein product [Eruca vesicaria subsp. sativa]|uniref:Protein RALF-like 27 n=1 Tax=Eruca vesicaria subsp. sativa TaxID=29727 RepID=A0ABC8M656_ERUVS|nr:unnamed protein product [Eruca vesicaria subsp. sativa]